MNSDIQNLIDLLQHLVVSHICVGKRNYTDGYCIGSKFERNLPAPILDRMLITMAFAVSELTHYIAPPHMPGL
jgi:hypothetical protein